MPCASGGAPLVELTVVTPTLNERANIDPLVDRLGHALGPIRWQIVVVDDDSRDGTAEHVKTLANRDDHVRCIRRVGRFGLSGAVLEGALSSAAPYIAIMDADLQHDEVLLPRMLDILRRDEADLVIASRYLSPKTQEAGLSRARGFVSRLGNRMANFVLKSEVSDPVSGFFMIRRDAFDTLAPHLSPSGFKILFDIIATARGRLRIAEVPYVFRLRVEGDSKFNGKIALDYLGLVVSKLSRDLISPRALMFALVGSTGLVVHILVLKLALSFGFNRAQILAALTAMTSNYLINNALTYRDRRRAGWGMMGGYIRFCLLCGVGLIANVAVADLVRDHVGVWWLAGAAGAAVGAGWNYLTTAVGVW